MTCIKLAGGILGVTQVRVCECSGVSSISGLHHACMMMDVAW